MDTTFSMVRVRNVMRRDLIENWKSNLYGLLGILQPSFSRCWAFYGRQRMEEKQAIRRFIPFIAFVAIC